MTTFQDAFDQAEVEVESGAIGTEALEGSPDVVVGDTESEGTVGEEVAEPTYFDLEAYGDQLVRIKVDGVERSVPLRELPSGFMRNEAFTQKSQALAEDRLRLQAAETLAAAYDRNPVETVRFLAQQQGITLAEAKAQAEAAGEQEEGWANDGYVDPRLSAIESRIAEMDAREARLGLEREIADLGTRFGTDFDANEVVAQAIKLGRTDLEGVYKELAYDRIAARLQAGEQVQSQRVAEDAKTVQAKQALASTVASGESFAGAGDAGSAPITSVAQALEAAMASSGFNF